MEDTKLLAWNIVGKRTGWFFKNIASGTVISSRVRLARNLWKFPFPHNMTSEQAEEVEKTVLKSIFDYRDAGDEMFIIKTSDISDIEKGFLVERHMISEEFSENHLSCSAVIFPKEKLSIMINEEDHIRIQGMQPGLSLGKALASANKLDDFLGSGLNYAFSEKLGFLSSCPTNIGTGLRASALLHIPALLALRKERELFEEAEKRKIMVRGFYGEGSEPLGCFYQLSSKETTGMSEKEIIENLQNMVNLTEEAEKESLLLLAGKDKKKAAIAAAIEKALNNSGLASEKFFVLFSKLVLAKKLGILDIEEKKLSALFQEVLPFHMQLKKGKKMAPEERDAARGASLRKKIRRCADV